MVTKKFKILESDSYATTFMRFGGFVVVLRRECGEWSKVKICDLGALLLWYLWLSEGFKESDKTCQPKSLIYDLFIGYYGFNERFGFWLRCF